MSIPNPSLPGIRQALLDGSSASRPFYLFFQWAANNLPSVARQIDDLTVRVDALSGQGGISPNAGIRGSYSIITQGTLAAGIVQIGLQGDVASPGFTQYYGSDTTGAKGWFNVSDAFADSGNIEKTVSAEGVTSFDLTDVTITTGGALMKYSFDAKGRLSEQADATTSDLAEGDNLYFTDARARAAAVADAIDPSVTDVAPSQHAVAEALAGAASGVPYVVTDGSSYHVPAGIQALWAIPIDLEGDAYLDIEGALVEVN